MADPVKWPRPAWWAKFEIGPGGCWLWTGCKDRNGYGRTDLQGESKVYRVTYRVLVGPIPKGLGLDHVCRVKACANPSHLEPVTAAENMRRQHVARHYGTRCEHGIPRWGSLVLCAPCQPGHLDMSGWGLVPR